MPGDIAQEAMVLQAYWPLGCLYWQSDSRLRWRFLVVLDQVSQHMPGGLPPRPQGLPVCSPPPSCRPLEALYFTLPRETGSATGSRQPAGMHGHLSPCLLLLFLLPLEPQSLCNNNLSLTFSHLPSTQGSDLLSSSASITVSSILVSTVRHS